MSTTGQSLRTLLGLILFSISCGAHSAVSFDCIHGETPLGYGANPTLWSEFALSNPQLGNLFYGISVKIVNTATSPFGPAGPVTVTRSKPTPPHPTVWKVQNVFAYPPFSADWALASTATWVNLICVGGSCFEEHELDFCAGEAFISAPGGGGGGSCMIAAPQTSTLTLAGRLQAMPKPARSSPLLTRRLAEDGRSVVSDEFAVTTGTGLPTLQVRHQVAHPENENSAPTPSVRLLPQRVTRAHEHEGQRGFAAIEIGQSGKVLRVRALSGSGAAGSSSIEAAIAQGVQSTFQDERRHDHTAYLVYEVRRGVLRGVGRGLVSMPQCCSCDPNPYDDIEVQCP